MKKKIFFLCIGIAIIMVAVVILFKSTHRSIDSLMIQFESAVNSEDKDKLLNCYPCFLNEKLDNYISVDSMKEFHENVGDIKITNVKNVSNMDLSDAKKLQTEIQEEYNIDIDIDDYQFITFSYHADFDETIIQVVKIKNKYYLYTGDALPEPISYFVN